MKYKIVLRISIIIVCMSMLGGCYTTQQIDDKIDMWGETADLPAQTTLTLDSYFPVVKDTVWHYKGETYLKDMTVWVDYIKDNVFQLRFKDGTMEMAKVYLQEEDAIYEVATIENITIKQDYTNLRQYKNAVLKLPLEKGEKWLQIDGTIKTITDTDVKIETPLGVVNAIEVVSEGDGFTLTEYYGQKLGKVKSVYKKGTHEETKELTAYEYNVPIKDYITVYLGNKETRELDAIEQEIAIRTNEEPKHFLTDLLSKVTEEKHIVSLPAGTMINSIYYDEVENKITLDMNEAYNQTSHETGSEKLAIMSLVKTVGKYYGVSEVILTVEGSPYTSVYLPQKIGAGIKVEE